MVCDIQCLQTVEEAELWTAGRSATFSHGQESHSRPQPGPQTSAHGGEEEDELEDLEDDMDADDDILLQAAQMFDVEDRTARTEAAAAGTTIDDFFAMHDAMYGAPALMMAPLSPPELADARERRRLAEAAARRGRQADPQQLHASIDRPQPVRRPSSSHAAGDDTLICDDQALPFDGMVQPGGGRDRLALASARLVHHRQDLLVALETRFEWANRPNLSNQTRTA